MLPLGKIWTLLKGLLPHMMTVIPSIINERNIGNQVVEKLEYIDNNEIATYFFAADVVVLPYNEVTQSGVLQIAYAFGKPVVATCLGGFKEAVENGKNGFLVPPNNAKMLAEEKRTSIQ